MKLLETAGKTIRAAAAAVKAAATTSTSHRCSFNCDCARKAEVNARGAERWLGPRRAGWFR